MSSSYNVPVVTDYNYRAILNTIQSLESKMNDMSGAIAQLQARQMVDDNPMAAIETLGFGGSGIGTWQITGSPNISFGTTDGVVRWQSGITIGQMVKEEVKLRLNLAQPSLTAVVLLTTRPQVTVQYSSGPAEVYNVSTVAIPLTKGSDSDANFYIIETSVVQETNGSYSHFITLVVSGKSEDVGKLLARMEGADIDAWTHTNNSGAGSVHISSLDLNTSGIATRDAIQQGISRAVSPVPKQQDSNSTIVDSIIKGADAAVKIGRTAVQLSEVLPNVLEGVTTAVDVGGDLGILGDVLGLFLSFI
jgi:hypothetical protein